MSEKTGNGANLCFENQLWGSADKLRGHMYVSEYKYVVLGLIFLKYISDAFHAKYKELESIKDTEYTDPEDRDEFVAANIFCVLKEARWARLQASAKQPSIGKIVDDAMVAIEKEKMERLTAQLYQQFAESDKLEVTIKKNLETLGYGF